MSTAIRASGADAVAWHPDRVGADGGAAMPGISDDEYQAIAEWLEEENPRWIVVFGVFSRQFIGFPRFDVPRGTMVVASYPDAIPARMREAERLISPKGRHGEA
jgi:hypothetical protein